ncbi:MAG: hypothetical protein IBGAMO2_130052 [Arenicellales bacterium IbO2]|nr:MAG: hypothetical protein IBGAMO2_130052 [Arenicellales bacterium IbO2]
MIDNDEAAEQNYMRLLSQVLEGVLESKKGSMTLEEFREEILVKIQDSVKLLFPDLVLNKLRSFSAGGETLRFDKGGVEGFAYDNLSGGEKAAFDLILDFVVKRQEFDDTVFCIDEPEAHIAVGIQGKLLDVIYRLVPDNCQLWIATHSIGMMRKAYELYKKDSGKVVFLDFDVRDFDNQKGEVIEPAKMDRALWKRMHEVVLDDLADLVSPEMLYICESTPEKSFDAKCYNKIFSSEYPDVEFVSVGGKKEVKKFVSIVQKATPGQKIFGVRDRDNATPEEVQKARDEGVRVLSRVCIEAYLLDDDVLTAFCRDPRHVLPSETLNAIKGIRDKNKHNPKRAAGAIRGYLIDEHKRGHLIGEHKGLQIGDDNAGFLLHLADLVTPKMPIYQELERDIFGNGNM